jgi:UDP-GlcNAc:undecaprenyl-phosphate GlcNAc-1-phosphate transferase
VDRPDDLLKPHARPIAYLGGLGVCAGFIPPVVIGAIWYPHLWPLATCIILATLITTLTGLLDDLHNLRPKYKVLGQVIAAAALYAGLCTVNVHREAANMFLLPFNELLGRSWAMPVWLAVPISALVTVVILVAASNATNLIDGLDGLCGGVTGIISLGFLALTTYLACYGHYHGGLDEFRVILCLGMAGAVFGFLPYNAPPASIFLGDAGSMLLGFFVATILMLFSREGTLRWFLGAGVIFSLPVADTALAVVRRALAGKSIFHGDRSHLYDQLVDRGMSVKQVVVLFYVLSVVAAALGVAQSVFLRLRHAILLDAIIAIAVAAIFIKKGMLRPETRKP